jgi:hypothetical protein
MAGTIECINGPQDIEKGRSILLSASIPPRTIPTVDGSSIIVQTKSELPYRNILNGLIASHISFKKPRHLFEFRSEAPRRYIGICATNLAVPRRFNCTRKIWTLLSIFETLAIDHGPGGF